MVMEYLDGADLTSWVRQRGPMATVQAVEFVLQACVGVAEAHAQGIVHRDLKPSNLFCVRRSDGQSLIKVLDFGISKVSEAVLGNAEVTRTGSVMGSPLYMSPEQMRSARDVDAQTDIWAMGVILFELLTGRTPFFGDTLTEVAIQVATEHAPPIRHLRPEVPAGLAAVIERCLQKDRRTRYRTIAELGVALLPFGSDRARMDVERISGILQGPSPPGGTTAVAPPLPERIETLIAPDTLPPVGRTTAHQISRKTAAYVAALGAAVAVAGVAGAMFLLQRPSPPESPSNAATRSQGASSAAAPPSAATVEDVSPPRVEATTMGPPQIAPPPPLVPVLATTPTVKEAVTSATRKPAAPPASSPAAPQSSAGIPCKLVKSLDRNGEAHFSCPCTHCQ
jgi:serine/threonine-protein kinase